MNAALDKWIKDAIKSEELLTWHELASPLSRRAAHFWLRAFCDEVERRAERQLNDVPIQIKRIRAFDELKRELLEGK